jgi:hypothetical protein
VVNVKLGGPLFPSDCLLFIIMAFPYYSGQMKNNPFNDNTNDDDEFGEFTSAVTFSPAHTPTGKIWVVNDIVS